MSYKTPKDNVALYAKYVAWKTPVAMFKVRVKEQEGDPAVRQAARKVAVSAFRWLKLLLSCDAEGEEESVAARNEALFPPRDGATVETRMHLWCAGIMQSEAQALLPDPTHSDLAKEALDIFVARAWDWAAREPVRLPQSVLRSILPQHDSAEAKARELLRGLAKGLLVSVVDEKGERLLAPRTSRQCAASSRLFWQRQRCLGGATLALFLAGVLRRRCAERNLTGGWIRRTRAQR
jgi:hypothetical protein